MSDDTPPDEPDRAAIVRRRNRFVAIALASVAAQGCYESHGPAGEDSGTMVADANRDPGQPVPCLGIPIEDAGRRDLGTTDTTVDAPPPMPCLEAPFDAGPETDGAATDSADAAPSPCLSAALLVDSEEQLS